MWPAPDNPDVLNRMRTALRTARAALDVQPDQDGHEVWGCRGRTLSQPVIGPYGPAWLRVACAPASQADTTFWDSSLAAEKAIPRAVPRPRLRRHHDWNDEPWKYRAELYDRVAARPAATSPRSRPTATPSSRNTSTRPCHGSWAHPSPPPHQPGPQPTATSTSPTSAHPPSTSWTGKGGDSPRPATTPQRCTSTACSFQPPPPESAANSRTSSTPPPATSPNSPSSQKSSTAPPAATTATWPNRCATAPRSSSVAQCHFRQGRARPARRPSSAPRITTSRPACRRKTLATDEATVTCTRARPARAPAAGSCPAPAGPATPPRAAAVELRSP